jgi:fucose permease
MLVMGIAGAAVIPLFYGFLVDRFKATSGLGAASQNSYAIMIPIYLFILYFAALGYKKR